MIGRPKADECSPYHTTYIDQVPGRSPAKALRDSKRELLAILEKLTPEQWDQPYAPGKWTIKESLQHMIDTERVFTYRALWVARGDRTALPGFNQEDFSDNAHANERTPASLLTEYKAVRAATTALFNSFNDGDWKKRGTASGQPITVRALYFITAGHERHHVEIFKRHL